MKRFDILTIFPNILDSYFQESLIKKAQDKGLVKIATHNLRDFSDDRNRKVDDTPYGGGPGMVLQVGPIAKAVEYIKTLPAGRQEQSAGGKKRVIAFSLRGAKFNQTVAHRLSKYDQLIFICGRYEGIDERVAQHIADEEISLGDFVLSGGELPAAAVIETVARLIPGMLGTHGSLEEYKGTYPVYTKPEYTVVKGKKRSVPKVLLGGDHAKIQEWRERQNG